MRFFASEAGKKAHRKRISAAPLSAYVNAYGPQAPGSPHPLNAYLFPLKQQLIHPMPRPTGEDSVVDTPLLIGAEHAAAGHLLPRFADNRKDQCAVGLDEIELEIARLDGKHCNQVRFAGPSGDGKGALCPALRAHKATTKIAAASLAVVALRLAADQHTTVEYEEREEGKAQAQGAATHRTRDEIQHGRSVFR